MCFPECTYYLDHNMFHLQENLEVQILKLMKRKPFTKMNENPCA